MPWLSPFGLALDLEAGIWLTAPRRGCAAIAALLSASFCCLAVTAAAACTSVSSLVRLPPKSMAFGAAGPDASGRGARHPSEKGPVCFSGDALASAACQKAVSAARVSSACGSAR